MEAAVPARLLLLMELLERRPEVEVTRRIRRCRRRAKLVWWVNIRPRSSRARVGNHFNSKTGFASCFFAIFNARLKDTGMCSNIDVIVAAKPGCVCIWNWIWNYFRVLLCWIEIWCSNGRTGVVNTESLTSLVRFTYIHSRVLLFFCPKCWSILTNFSRCS